MGHLTRHLTPFFILLCLLTACGTTTGPTQPKVSVHATATVSRPTATPTSTATSLPEVMTCPDALSKESGCMTPHDLRVAYGVESLIQQGYTGKGQTIIDIVSFGSPTLTQDMALYDRAFNLPTINMQVISPLNEAESDPYGDKNGWAGETTLDVQIMHALAPDAKIIVLTSPVAETEGIAGLPEFRQLEQYVIDHKLGNIVSQSWGSSETTLKDAAGQQEIQAWNTLLQQGTIQDKISYFNGSGDQGSTDYIDNAGKQLGTSKTTSFADDSPWVTSVGGTTVTHQGTSYSETAWNSNGGASGGGFSNFFAMPDYQKTLPNATQAQFNNQRGVPDVSADADPSTGLAMLLQGQWSTAGGTSASTPLWAAITAIANQKAGHPLGFINPGLYKVAASSTYAQDFHDITSGNNTNAKTNVPGYDTTPGWDPVTGLGTPNAEKLIPDLIAALG